MSTIGLIAPGEPLAPEYDKLIQWHGCAVHTRISEAADSHVLEDVVAAGEISRLTEATRSLAGNGADVIVWACTSGSFALGLEAARQQTSAITAIAGVPSSSTSLALLAALEWLEVDTVAAIAPYPAEVAERFAEFLAEAGFAVRALEVLPTAGPSVSSRLTGATLDDAVARLAEHDSLVVVPDTAIAGCRLWPTLRSGGQVLFANQWTIWHALQLAGVVPAHRSLGSLSGVRI